VSDTVRLTIPSDTRNVALARTVAAAMSARADLPLDQLEDVRLAVDEAVSQLILDATPGTPIECSFTIVGESLSISVSGHSVSGSVPATGTFSWTVLTALVDDVTATVQDGTLTLRLRVTRDIEVDA
jgi:serine/threonine-protein kinase RsbW